MPVTLTAADAESRIIAGRIVQWNAEGNTSAGRTMFEPNSIKFAKNTKLVLQHDQTRPLGKLMEWSEDENANFIFGTGNNVITGSFFWVISIERANYKQSLFPGSLNLQLSGSGGIINLTDNSVDSPVNQFIGATQVYQLISGSNGTAGSLANSGYVAGSGSYGLVFPQLGTILLNPYAVSQSIGLFPSRSNNSDGLNNARLFNSILLGDSFALNSQETVTSDYVFVRARNSEFNYSENPSFISGSTGEVIYSNFINAPQVYITTVGMYNDSNDLLAVAKMSRPLLKDFTKEALVRVKLDF